MFLANGMVIMVVALAAQPRLSIDAGEHSERLRHDFAREAPGVTVVENPKNATVFLRFFPCEAQHCFELKDNVGNIILQRKLTGGEGPALRMTLFLCLRYLRVAPTPDTQDTGGVARPPPPPPPPPPLFFPDQVPLEHTSSWQPTLRLWIDGDFWQPELAPHLGASFEMGIDAEHTALGLRLGWNPGLCCATRSSLVTATSKSLSAAVVGHWLFHQNEELNTAALAELGVVHQWVNAHGSGPTASAQATTYSIWQARCRLGLLLSWGGRSWPLRLEAAAGIQAQSPNHIIKVPDNYAVAASSEPKVQSGFVSPWFAAGVKGNFF